MTEQSTYYHNRGNPLITAVSLKVRTRIYGLFAERFRDAQKIADVGVTSEQVSPDANFLEKLHPNKDRITAVGIEDASHLERQFPGMRFVAVKPDEPLPFGDGVFDVVFSHAVIEHVVDADGREAFFSELLRVGKAVFITTPNLFFPVELHTKVPLIHFLFPRFFFWLLDRGFPTPSYHRKNLRLLSRRDLRRLAQTHPGWEFEVHGVRLLGLVSNWVLVGRRKP